MSLTKAIGVVAFSSGAIPQPIKEHEIPQELLPHMAGLSPSARTAAPLLGSLGLTGQNKGKSTLTTGLPLSLQPVTQG